MSRFKVGLRAVPPSEFVPPPGPDDGFVDGNPTTWPMALVLLSGCILIGAIFSNPEGANHSAATTPGSVADAAVWSVSYSTNGRLLASTTIDGRVLLEDLMTGESVTVHQGSAGSVRAVAFSADSTTLMAAGDGPLVRRWNVDTFEETAPISTDSSGFRSLAISPDGSLMAVTSRSGGTLELLDGASGRTRVTLQANGPNSHAVVFSRDGQALASARTDGTVCIWDVASGHARGVFRAHDDAVQSLAFSANGRWLASSGRLDPTVRLWDPATGEPRGTLAGHGVAVNAVAFAPSGDVLATGHLDGTVTLWDAARQKLISAFHDDRRAVWSLAFSPDGRVLTCGGSSRTISLADFARPERLANPLEAGATDL